MSDFDQVNLVKALSPQELGQLEQYRFLVDTVQMVNEQTELSPTVHSDRWEEARLRKFGELAELVDSSQELRSLFLGVIAVGCAGGEAGVKDIKQSFIVLRQFEPDHTWLEAEETRIADLTRLVPVASVLEVEANNYAELFVSDALDKTDGAERRTKNITITSEGFRVDGQSLRWSDNTYQRSARRVFSDEDAGKAIHGFLKLFSQIKPDSDGYTPTVKLMRSIEADETILKMIFPDLTELAEHELQRTGKLPQKESITLRSRIEMGFIKKANKLLKANNLPPLLEKSEGYDRGLVGFRVNPTYRLGFEKDES